MYIVRKTIEIAGSHSLTLPYDSPCRRPHGHNWLVTVYCRAETLNPQGMVIDFKQVKELIHGRLDHQCLNDIVDFNPTAENMARWICEQVPGCFRVDVEESRNNSVTYIADDSLHLL